MPQRPWSAAGIAGGVGAAAAAAVVAELTGAADAGGAPVASGARWSPAGRPAVFFDRIGLAAGGQQDAHDQGRNSLHGRSTRVRRNLFPES
jgi:hypothetical protein